VGSFRPLSGKSILVVEDEPLIAFDVMDTLTDAGANAVFVRDCSAAIHKIDTGKIDAAILDIHLASDETCEEVCVRLGVEGIPFIFFTAYSDVPILRAWPDVPILKKPALPLDVIPMLAGVVR
jgi:CheY-like chemotaxis protein